MIPPDIASRLQSSADTALRPVAQPQELSDKLSGLVAGQRVMAEVQAMLPNGTYRAMINQNSITLALPFSAKSGDTLELLVTESEGKTALAVVSHQTAKDGQSARESVSATLSRTAQFISQLASRQGNGQEGGKALPLNNNQPIAPAPPNTAQDILPLLKQAIAQSGMFYESHQAEWVEGRFQQNGLLQEPQGRLSSPQAQQAAVANASANTPAATVPTTAGLAGNDAAVAVSTRATAEATATQSANAPLVAQQLQPVVQHQLDALATQHFVWQGQAWPGQTMRWEIEEDGRGHDQSDDETASSWRTGLKLALPSLGAIDARIVLNGTQITLDISVEEERTSTRMQTESAALYRQLDDAGLVLNAIRINRIPPAPDGTEHAPEVTG